MYDNTEPVAGKTYSDEWWAGWLDKQLNGVSTTDISSYLDDRGVDPTSDQYNDYSSAITDPKMLSDFTAAKTAAQKSGNTKLVNTLDLVFKYGEKAIAALVAAGVLDGPSLAQAGYSNVSQDANGKIVIGQTTTPTQAAPLQSNKIFGLDFSSPTVIMVTFLVVMFLIYFLFFNKPTPARK
ncbi:hypothetical protein [Spirosoma litoris]